VWKCSFYKLADCCLEFVECTNVHLVTVNYSCSKQKLAMNSCLRSHGTPKEEDRARAEWHDTVVEKKRKEAEVETERLRKIYAERKRLEEAEEKLNKKKPPEVRSSSWWPFSS